MSINSEEYMLALSLILFTDELKHVELLQATTPQTIILRYSLFFQSVESSYPKSQIAENSWVSSFA